MKQKTDFLPQVTKDSLDDFLKADGVSPHHLMKFKHSPQHYLWYLKDKEEQDHDKRNMILQEAICTYLSNQEKFYEEYKCLKNAMLPAVNKIGVRNYTMKENVKFRDEFQKANAGKNFLGEEEYDLVENACKVALECKAIKEIFSSGTLGQSAYARDEKTKMYLKGRCNWISDNPEFMPCTITAGISYNNGMHPFIKKMLYTGMYNAQAMQLGLFQKDYAIMIMLEDTKPFVCQPYWIEDNIVTYAQKENRMLMDIMRWCKRTGASPNYGEFEILMNDLYKKHNLWEADDESTYAKLCDLFEISKGLHRIAAPNYMI